MIKNVFKEFPDFINLDIRKERPDWFSMYNITPDFQFLRHFSMLPPELIKGKTILDLGSCVGGTGAWCLANGAKSYTGVELQDEFVEISKKCLTKYLSKKKWDIRHESFDEFFESNTEQYDIIVCFGSIYNSTHTVKFLEQMATVAKKQILIDGGYPPLQTMLKNLKIDENEHYNYKKIDNLSFIEVTEAFMVHESGHSMMVSTGTPTIRAIETVLNQHNFIFTKEHSASFGGNNGRYYLTFEKSKDNRFVPLDSATAYKTSDYEEIPFGEETKFFEASSALDKKWNYGKDSDTEFMPNDEWKFDNKVASIFSKHARQHIPDYERVIELSVDVCKSLIAYPNKAKIVDVGCAIGETLNKLHEANFQNLVGVDNSIDMLTQAQKLVDADWAWDSNFPVDKGPFTAILCNWTLHFIKDKKSYIQSMYDSLEPGGFLILTDKTHNDGLELKLYHNFKRKQGVSDEEIEAKANSLKDVMFINDPMWYFQTIEEIGFINTAVINKTNCFTTFLAYKA